MVQLGAINRQVFRLALASAFLGMLANQVAAQDRPSGGTTTPAPAPKRTGGSQGGGGVGVEVDPIKVVKGIGSLFKKKKKKKSDESSGAVPEAGTAAPEPAIKDTSAIPAQPVETTPVRTAERPTVVKERPPVVRKVNDSKRMPGSKAIPAQQQPVRPVSAAEAVAAGPKLPPAATVAPPAKQLPSTAVAKPAQIASPTEKGSGNWFWWIIGAAVAASSAFAAKILFAPKVSASIDFQVGESWLVAKGGPMFEPPDTKFNIHFEAGALTAPANLAIA